MVVIIIFRPHLKRRSDRHESGIKLGLCGGDLCMVLVSRAEFASSTYC